MSVNEELVRRVMAKIREVGEAGWDQRSFVSECGTTSCFAGWALRLSGYGIVPDGNGDWFMFQAPEGVEPRFPVPGHGVFADPEAQALLGLTDDQATAIFYFTPADDPCGYADCGYCVTCCGSGVDEFAKHVGHVLEMEGL